MAYFSQKYDFDNNILKSCPENWHLDHCTLLQWW